MYSNTTGSSNNSIGAYALYENVEVYNSAIGQSALRANTTGASNTAVGESALTKNTTASSNTAIGARSLYVNTTGASNTGWGKCTSIKYNRRFNTALEPAHFIQIPLVIIMQL